MINIRKRGNVYQYSFEAEKVNGKRKQISKSGFRTRNEALIAGQKKYDEYINGSINKESNMSYSDYLDFWMREYFEINYRYSTAKRYKETFETIKKEIGKYQIKQVQSKKVYGQKYYKYYLEAIRNKYGKICEYRVVENKRRIKNAVDFVFARINGRYVGTDIVRYPYKIIHHELNIKDCRFYDLRGSFATRCLRSGIEIKDISEILGHKSIETTENYYICSLEEDQRYANEVFEKLIQADIVKI